MPVPYCVYGGVDEIVSEIDDGPATTLHTGQVIFDGQARTAQGETHNVTIVGDGHGSTMPLRADKGEKLLWHMKRRPARHRCARRKWPQLETVSGFDILREITNNRDAKYSSTNAPK